MRLSILFTGLNYIIEGGELRTIYECINPEAHLIDTVRSHKRRIEKGCIKIENLDYEDKKLRITLSYQGRNNTLFMGIYLNSCMDNFDLHNCFEGFYPYFNSSNHLVIGKIHYEREQLIISEYDEYEIDATNTFTSLSDLVQISFNVDYDEHFYSYFYLHYFTILENTSVFKFVNMAFNVTPRYIPY